MIRWKPLYTGAMSDDELVGAVATADLIGVDYHGKRKWTWKRPMSEFLSRETKPPYTINKLVIEVANRPELDRLIRRLSELKA